jgi:hypothetical protein
MRPPCGYDIIRGGYDIIRVEGRYFPVRLHLDDLRQPGASAFTGSDDLVISFARRLLAIVYLYRQQRLAAQKCES